MQDWYVLFLPIETYEHILMLFWGEGRAGNGNHCYKNPGAQRTKKERIELFTQCLHSSLTPHSPQLPRASSTVIMQKDKRSDRKSSPNWLCPVQVENLLGKKKVLEIECGVLLAGNCWIFAVWQGDSS